MICSWRRKPTSDIGALFPTAHLAMHTDEVRLRLREYLQSGHTQTLIKDLISTATFDPAQSFSLPLLLASPPLILPST